MENETEENDVLDLKGVADILRMSYDHVRKLVAEGEIPGHKVGGVWRFSRHQIIQMVEGRL